MWTPAPIILPLLCGVNIIDNHRYSCILFFSCCQLIAGLYCSFQFSSCYSQSGDGSSSRKESMCHKMDTIKGGVVLFFCWNVKNFFLLHCVPLYVCRLCINYQDLRTNLLRMAALRILLLTFISHFVIDFLSI